MANFELGSIKKALVYMHDEVNNSRAIGKQDAETVNLSEQTLNNWIEYVESLRLASNAYLDAAHDPDADAKKLQSLQGAVWGIWRKVLKTGTEKDFDSRFFIRRADLTHICGLCGEKFMSTAKGKQLVHADKSGFRKNIETLIGCRIAGNGMLSDEDRDVISAYETAVHKIKTCKEALEGCKRGKEDIPGLNAKLKAEKKGLEEQEALAKDLNLTEEQTKKLTAGFKKSVEDIKAEIKDVKTALTKAEKTKKDNQAAYDKTMLTLRLAGLDD